MNEDEEKTTITLKKSTAIKLHEAKEYAESYDDLILRLLKLIKR